MMINMRNQDVKSSLSKIFSITVDKTIEDQKTFYKIPLFHCLCLAAFIFIFNVDNHAQANQDENYKQYYTIADDNYVNPMNSDGLTVAKNPNFRFFNSLDIKSFAPDLKDQVLDLLKWLRHDSEPPIPSEKYNRLNHFGSWLRDPFDNTCLNTRGKILARDSEVPVQLNPKNHCSVEKGLWQDPYSGKKITEAKEVQIDHFVPLKNAFISGAWDWNFSKRCLYANYMSNAFHLIAVSGTENMRKSDRTPANYLPPNNQFVCAYLDNWLKVKLIWNLTMLPPETQAIKQTMKNLGCSANTYVMDEDELTKERISILQGLKACQLKEKRMLERAKNKQNSTPSKPGNSLQNDFLDPELDPSVDTYEDTGSTYSDSDSSL